MSFQNNPATQWQLSQRTSPVGEFLMKAAAFRESLESQGFQEKKNKIALETCYNFMQIDMPLKQNSWRK